MKNEFSLHGMTVKIFDSSNPCNWVACLKNDKVWIEWHLFEAVSEETLSFIVLHEIGHLKYHNKNRLVKYLATNDSLKSFLMNQLKLPTLYEIQADKYALSILGYNTTLKSLKEVDGFIKNVVQKEIDYGTVESDVSLRLNYFKKRKKRFKH